MCGMRESTDTCITNTDPADGNSKSKFSPRELQLRNGPQVFGRKVVHHRGVEACRAVAESVATLVSGLSPLDLPVVVPHFRNRRALGPVLVAVAAVRVQRASAAARFVPLLVLVDGHEALRLALFSACPRGLALPVSGGRLAAGSPPRGALLPSLLTGRVDAA